MIAIELLPDPVGERSSSSAVTHIEKRFDEASSTVVMFCGLVAYIDADDNLHPPEADFFTATWGHKATCPGCLKAWRSA